MVFRTSVTQKNRGKGRVYLFQRQNPFRGRKKRRSVRIKSKGGLKTKKKSKDLEIAKNSTNNLPIGFFRSVRCVFCVWFVCHAFLLRIHIERCEEITKYLVKREREGGKKKKHESHTRCSPFTKCKSLQIIGPFYRNSVSMVIYVFRSSHTKPKSFKIA